MLFKQIQTSLYTLLKLFFSYSAAQTTITFFCWLKHFIIIFLILTLMIGFF